MVTTFLARILFKGLLIFSLPLIMFGYWPNHLTPQVKLLFMEYMSMSLAILSFFAERNRKFILWPALLFFVCLLNMFTHGLNQYTQTGVAYVFFFTLAFYAITNFIEDLDAENLKHVVIWCAAFNSVFAVMQFFQYSPAMDYDYHSRPMGFMTYPVLSSLLAAVGLILTKQNGWLLRVPMILCLVLRPELAVLIGLVVVCLIKHWNRITKSHLLMIGPALIMLIVFYKQILSYFHQRTFIRLDYWLGTFKYFWARPLDGWGIGGFGYFVEKLFPQTPHGAWNELHNEPLQALFELGVIGAIVLFCWGRHILKNFNVDDNYSLCLVVFLTASLGHAIFHFADGIWLFLIIYILWERNAATSKAR